MARSGVRRPARLARPGYVVAGLQTRLVVAALLVACASPAAAQVDFSGQWAPVYHEDNPERIPGPELADYTGLPLNDAARLQADSWDADRISVVSSYQCRPHSSDYGMRGLGNLRVWAELDERQQLLAFRSYMPAWGSERTIWMDGRPHPPEHAEHTFQGFSTGVWEGNMLTITTTHQKTNYYRRNGVPASDKRTVVEHWTRHGEFLTVITVVTDPVFLTEPLVRSQNWFNDVGQALPAFTCEYATEVPGAQKVPNHLPGANPYLTEFADWYGLELAATRGGAETMYPEYRLKMGAPSRKPPDRCQRYCACSGGFFCDVNPPRR
jgi:hypothetical protein